MQKLTGKEEEVLELMWQLGECAPKDIVAQYPEPQPHVNTIATMVQSLERKGLCEPSSAGTRLHLFPDCEAGGIWSLETWRFRRPLLQALIHGACVIARGRGKSERTGTARFHQRTKRE